MDFTAGGLSVSDIGKHIDEVIWKRELPSAETQDMRSERIPTTQTPTSPKSLS